MKDKDTHILEERYSRMYNEDLGELGQAFVAQGQGQVDAVKAWPIELKQTFFQYPESAWNDLGKHQMTDEVLGQLVYGGGTRGTEAGPLKTLVDDYVTNKNPASLTQIGTMLSQMAEEQKQKDAARVQQARSV